MRTYSLAVVASLVSATAARTSLRSGEAFLQPRQQLGGLSSSRSPHSRLPSPFNASPLTTIGVRTDGQALSTLFQQKRGGGAALNRNPQKKDNGIGYKVRPWCPVVSVFMYLISMNDLVATFSPSIAIRFPFLRTLLDVWGRGIFYWQSIPMMHYASFLGSYFILVQGKFADRKLPIPYIVRYHALQAMLLTIIQGVVLTLYYRVFNLHPLDENPINDLLTMMILISSFASIGSGMVAAARKRLNQIPIISEGVEAHIGIGPGSPRYKAPVGTRSLDDAE